MKQRIFMMVLFVLTGLMGTAAFVSASEQPETVEIPVLMYHHLRTDPAACGDYTVTPETFAGDLAYLKARRYQSVSAKQLIQFTNGDGSLPEKPVLITFDDGQRSFAVHALPILEEYDMCAILAVVGSFADLYTENGDTDPCYAYSNWAELSELENSGRVELAVHSYDMHRLEQRRGCGKLKGESDSAYRTAFLADLTRAEARFQEELGTVPDVFVYPYGIYNDTSQSILREKGYSLILTCDQQVNELSASQGSPLCLGRFNRPCSIPRETFFSAMGIQ